MKNIQLTLIVSLGESITIYEYDCASPKEDAQKGKSFA